MNKAKKENPATAQARVGGAGNFKASRKTHSNNTTLNITRYGRLTVGINGKAKYQDKNGSPWVQRVHVWQPERRYSVEEVAEA